MTEVKKNNNSDANDTNTSNIGWSFEHDELLSNWGDKAACYTWMHDATQRKFTRINMCLGIPVIVLSTISGTANFGISTIFPPGFNYGNAVIGVLSLITGVISTVSNFLGYAQLEEAHRIAGIQWSKFKRTIETELSVNPTERKNVTEFIKYCKAELDRLMEQSPIVPQVIIDRFIKTFRKVKDVKMPEICNKLEPTTLYSELYNARTNNVDNKIDALLNASKQSDISTSDQNIIKKVTSKVNQLNSNSSPVFLQENENESEDTVVTIKSEEANLNINIPKETIVNYSNAETNINVDIDDKVTGPETNINSIPEKITPPSVKLPPPVKSMPIGNNIRRVFNRPIVYGKK